MTGRADDSRPWKPDPRGEGFILLVKVMPSSAHSAIAGLRSTAEGPALLVRIAAAPEKGKANEALVAFLAQALSLPRSKIDLRSGLTSRLKTIGLPAECGLRLDALLCATPP